MAMKLALVGNCQLSGLAVFLRRAMPQHEIRDMPHLATFYEEFTEEQIAETHAWADIVFFHHKHDGKQDYPTKQPKVPMSVWYQSGPFIIHTPDAIWETIKGVYELMGEDFALRVAVEEADMGYCLRWNHCASKMRDKEIEEQVPERLRISDLMEQGKANQLQLTCNHPTSLVFWHWCDRVCAYLHEIPHPAAISELECYQNPNIAGLPCEESATSGARKHIGLSWGGRPEDEESGRFITRQKLGLA